MKKIVIFGTKDFAELAHFYISADGIDQVCAFTMDKDYIEQNEFKGLPVVPFEELETLYPPQDYYIFVPMSYSSLNESRKRKYYEAKAKGYRFYSYISPKATYYGTPVGENCFIFENNVIQPFTKIGNNVILWSGNHIGHHSTIEDHVFVSSHVVISGHVTIGEGSFLGVNSTINNGISIGKYNVLSSGALIHKTTEDYSVYKAARAEKAAFKSNELKGF